MVKVKCRDGNIEWVGDLQPCMDGTEFTPIPYPTTPRLRYPEPPENDGKLVYFISSCDPSLALESVQEITLLIKMSYIYKAH